MIAIEGQDSMRDDGGWGVAVTLVDENIHPVAGENFNGSIKCWLRESVRVHAHKERTSDAFAPAILDNCLSDCSHVVVIKTAVQGTTAVP